MRTILAAALVLTALNACKPLVVDDPLYVLYARQILAQPADPYGFEVLWFDRLEPALHVTVPPVLPYWIAGGMALVGEQPFAWKLCLLPFALLLTASLGFLLRRLAPGIETPVLWCSVLSPAVLPSFNAMLDVPMLALGVGSIALTVHALERRSLRLATFAGLLGGLAMQTKYPGVVPLATAVALALRAREGRIALTVGGVAALVFAGWEGFALLRYGESPFLYGLLESSTTRDVSKPVLAWTVSLLCLLGATSSTAGLLALAALGVRTAGLVAAGLCVALVFAAVPFLPAAPLAFAASSEPDFSAPRPELWLFGALGLALFAALATLAHKGSAAAEKVGAVGAAPVTALPLFWIGFEVAGFFLFSPFPAVRRVIGLGVALTLWTASAAAAGHAPIRHVRAIAIWGAALGLLFFAADLSDALTRRTAVLEAIERVRAIDPDRTANAWFTGHWDFRYHAERAGLRPVVPGASALAAGDLLLVPRGVERQPLAIDPGQLLGVARLTSTSPFPWTSIPSFYTGPVALRSQPDVHISVSIYRARRDFVTAPARRRPIRPPSR